MKVAQVSTPSNGLHCELYFQKKQQEQKGEQTKIKRIYNYFLFYAQKSNSS